jgi:7,8-dihydropterin-6-yl-methyl-4-(beta-D-ribofuranosyl)aminobenzene 5'-phosphate synthase
LAPAENIRITTIVENSTSVGGVLAEWGISVFIEVGENCFLLDTGTSGIMVPNADRLGIDLKKTEVLVLSHGHYDHTGGLEAVMQRIHRPEVRVVAHPEVFGRKYSHNKKKNTYRYAGIPFCRDRLESLGARFELGNAPVWLTEDIAASGEEPMTTDFEAVADNLCLKQDGRFVQDPMADDQSLYIRTDLGLIIILGCAHRGMINIIRHARQLMDIDRVYMVIGGTHLGPASQEQVDKTVQALREMDVAWLGVSHCTGLPVAARLAREFEGRFFFNSAGTVIRFPYTDPTSKRPGG